jgi:hypothetical protein
LKDKKASSVVKALTEQVLPNFLRLPSRILTDNGPEFRSDLFNELLQEHSIDHVYSTKYRAAGNGAVERGNRTIAEFVRSIVTQEPMDWHVALSKAVLVYNSTWHSQIKDTPCNFLLSKSHSFNVSGFADSQVNWKDSHPKFQPFEIDQKVALKVNRIGNQLHYKLSQKYTGPYTIVKVQNNGVTYEIVDQFNNVQKVHHKQLKKWHDYPDYLAEFLPRTDTFPDLPDSTTDSD